MHSDLELLVMADMYDHGYNWNDPEDIKLYWESVLNNRED